MNFSRTCALLTVGLLALAARPVPGAAQTTPPHLPQLEAKYFSYASESLAHAVEERMTLPAGYPEDLEHEVVLHLSVTPAGHAENARLGLADPPVSAVVAAAVLAAVRQLPVLAPGREAGQPVPATLTLRIRPGVAAAAANRAAEARAVAEADSTEAHTLRAGRIQSQPGETLKHLLHRMLPASCPDTATKLVRYTWFSNQAGQPAFFWAHGRGQQEGEAVLFVLSPLPAATYNVQAISLGSMGDVTDVASLFFADTNHDGQKELLALQQCDLREGPSREAPLGGRRAHYQTTVFYYWGLDAAGLPRYKYEYLPVLDGLATAAEVRQALAAPPLKKAPHRNPRVKAAN